MCTPWAVCITITMAKINDDDNEVIENLLIIALYHLYINNPFCYRWPYMCQLFHCTMIQGSMYNDTRDRPALGYRGVWASGTLCDWGGGSKLPKIVLHKRWTKRNCWLWRLVVCLMLFGSSQTLDWSWKKMGIEMMRSWVCLFFVQWSTKHWTCFTCFYLMSFENPWHGIPISESILECNTFLFLFRDSCVWFNTDLISVE